MTFKDDSCVANLDIEISFIGAQNFGDSWFEFDTESRLLIINLNHRAIKYGVKDKKLVIVKVKAYFKDLENIEITSDEIAFVLEFEPAKVEEKVDLEVEKG